MKRVRDFMRQIREQGELVAWHGMAVLKPKGNPNQIQTAPNNQNKHNLIFHVFSCVNKINQCD